MKAICNDTGKIIYPNEMKARGVIVFLRQTLKHKTPDGKRIKHRRGKVEQKRVYYCSSCGGFHLTKLAWEVYKGKRHSSNKLKRYEKEFII